MKGGLMAEESPEGNDEPPKVADRRNPDIGRFGLEQEQNALF
jgi:hypothetical protein